MRELTVICPRCRRLHTLLYTGRGRPRSICPECRIAELEAEPPPRREPKRGPPVTERPCIQCGEVMTWPAELRGRRPLRCRECQRKLDNARWRLGYRRRGGRRR